MHAHLASTSQRAAALRRLTLYDWLFQQTCRSILHLCSLKSSFPGFPLCLLQHLAFYPIPHTPTVLDSSLARHLLLKFIQIIFNHLYWAPELSDRRIHILRSLNVRLDHQSLWTLTSVFSCSPHGTLCSNGTEPGTTVLGTISLLPAGGFAHLSPPYTPFFPCPCKGTPFVPPSLNGIFSVLFLCYLPFIGEGMFSEDDSPR